MKSKISILGMIGVLFAPLVSAYSSSLFGYYSSPVDIFVNSEWMRFLLVFGVFYALIFYSMRSMMKGEKNKGVAMITSICISLLIATALAQKGWFSGYYGDDISGWVLLLAVFLVFAFLIRMAYKNLGPKFTGFALIFIWILLAFYFNPYDIVGSGSAGNLTALLYGMIISIPGALVTLIIALILLFMKSKKNKGINIAAAE